MNNNLKIAKRLVRLAKSMIAVEYGYLLGDCAHRWVGELEGREFVEQVSLALEQIDGFEYQNGTSISEEQLRKLPNHFWYIASCYRDEKARLEKALKFIDESKYLRLGDDWESAGDFKKGEYIMLNVCATEEIYKIACDEFDRLCDNFSSQGDEDKSTSDFSEELAAAEDKADKVFEAEMAKLRAIVP